MDKDTTKSTFNEVLNRFPYENFCALIKDTGADRYIKKLFTTKLLYIMVIAQITQVESLRELADRVKNDVDLQENLKLDSIRASQLSRRLRGKKSGFWGTVFSQVAIIAMQKTNHMSATPYANRIHIMDASTITLCLTVTNGPITVKQKQV